MLSDRISTLLLHPFLLVATGGAIGSVLRYILTRAIDGTTWHGGIPWGTFSINVAGSFLLGFLVIGLLERPDIIIHRELFLLFGTGLCGGFTTFSSFELETFRLLREGNWPAALGYVLGSIVVGLVGTFSGVWLALKLFGPRG